LQTLLVVGLVRRESTGRFALRPPVRRYAAELLDASGRARATHLAALDALAGIGERYVRRWVLDEGDGRRALNREAANILALLDWARDADPQAHARLIGAVGWWAQHANLGSIARSHVELALERVDDPAIRAACLHSKGVLALTSTDASACLAAADAWRALGDVEGEATALGYGSNLFAHAGLP